MANREDMAASLSFSHTHTRAHVRISGEEESIKVGACENPPRLIFGQVLGEKKSLPKYTQGIIRLSL